METNAPVESIVCWPLLVNCLVDIATMRRSGTFPGWIWFHGLCCLGIFVVLCDVQRLFAADVPSPNEKIPAPPAAGASSPDPADVNLDALLDLAEKAPESLQSINVKEAPPSLSVSPDLVFNPNERPNSGNSIGELLTNAPGVISRSTSALNQDARIRGYSGSQAVAVTNGMNQGRTRLDIDSLFSQIDPSLVDSITVIAGPYSVE